VKNTNTLNLFIIKTPVSRFFFYFFTLFIFQSLIFGILFFSIQEWFHILIFETELNFVDSIYFSFSFSLQIVKYDLLNINIFLRILILIQSLVGKIFFGIGISYLTIKILLPNENTVVFAPIAFYIKNEEKFCVMLVNTSKTLLTNLKFISIEKYHRRHRRPYVIFVPYLKNSVLTLKLEPTDILKENPRDFDPMEDGLKVSLACSLPFSQYSIAVKYSFDKIFFIESTDFRDVPILQEPDLSSTAFWDSFNNPVNKKESLTNYFQKKRKEDL